jgi:hypothetical protein
MAATARELGFLLFGGSSIPLCPRQPDLALPGAAPVREVVAVYSAHFPGDREAYGYHSVELAQSLCEQRQGSETGIARVTAWEGDALWEQFDQGVLSRMLLERAAQVSAPASGNDYRERCRSSGRTPDGFCIEHADGLKVTHVNLAGHASGHAIAMQLEEEPEPRVARVQHGGRAEHYPHFAALAARVEAAMLSGRPSFPPERSLLTTGAIAAAMRAFGQMGAPLATPELELPYHSP